MRWLIEKNITCWKCTKSTHALIHEQSFIRAQTYTYTYTKTQTKYPFIFMLYISCCYLASTLTRPYPSFVENAWILIPKWWYVQNQCHIQSFLFLFFLFFLVSRFDRTFSILSISESTSARLALSGGVIWISNICQCEFSIHAANGISHYQDIFIGMEILNP